MQSLTGRSRQKRSTGLIGLAWLFLAGALRAAPPAETRTLDGLFDCADPAIIATPARGGYTVFATGRGIPIWFSRDLFTWSPSGRVFTSGVPPWAAAAVPGTRTVWAPDIALYNGKYLLYYAVSTFGSQRSVIGLAVNRTLDPAEPAYRWEDRGLVLESAQGQTDFNAIDPAFVLDRQGVPYLFWGSFWTGIKAAPVDPRTGRLREGAPVTAIATRAAHVNPPAIEAPYVIWRDGFYYLFVSWDFTAGGARSDYKVAVGRATQVLGPYADAQGRPMLEGGGTLVLTSHGRWSGPGHNSVLRTDDADWLVHHAIETDHVHKGRVLQIRPLYWLAGWPLAGAPLAGPATRNRTGAGPAAAAVGSWQHQVQDAPPIAIELRAGGTLTGGGPAGAGWTQRDRRLTLRWPAKEAPGGAWRDEAVLETDGRGYVGRNQAGALVRGWR